MSQSALPSLSVLLPTRDDFSTIRQTVRALSRQTVCDSLELVIIAPTEHIDVPADEVSMFASTRVVYGGRVRTSNHSRCRGVRAASAPFVVLSEDHSSPEPGWAAAIIAAHAEGFAVVGPVMINANPNSAMSWANLLLEYGPWLDGEVRRETDHLPGHNSSYYRAILMSYGDNLERMLENETVIQLDIASRGHRLLLEPGAKTRHLNFSRIRDSIPMRFNCGRSFAGHRVIGWSRSKRIAFAIGAPLIPLVRLTRVLRMVRASDRYSALFPRIIPMLALAVVADGLGEMVGYILGPGGAPDFLGTIEFNRVRSLNDTDQADYWKMIGDSA
ncbi:MAG TPA: glycosyltransferase family A protein [Gemmatimonadaceae bacterium]|nr:glycosyltransferase family A protein [Gemmatimonadaceae bacterium]